MCNWSDEAQMFMNPLDARFAETCRSSFGCSVNLVQSISALYTTMEPAQAKAQTDALLANLSTKIFHRNGDHVTNTWAADSIAKTLVRRRGGSWSRSSSTSYGENEGSSFSLTTSPSQQSSTGGWSWGRNYSRQEQVSVSGSWQEQMDYEIPPQLFTTLRGGGPDNYRKVEAIVFKAGRRWKRTGRTWLDVTFRQQ